MTVSPAAIPAFAAFPETLCIRRWHDHSEQCPWPSLAHACVKDLCSADSCCLNAVPFHAVSTECCFPDTCSCSEVYSLLYYVDCKTRQAVGNIINGV